MTNASRSHDEAVIELLREDPSFADEYLAAAMEEAGGPLQTMASMLAGRVLRTASSMGW